MTEPTDNQTDQRDRHPIKDGLDAARDRANVAYETSRDRARQTARQTGEAIEGNPLGVLVGGLAVGAFAAAVLPRSRREKELLAPLGRKIGAAAIAATAAAKEAGRAELDELSLSRNAVKDQAKSLFDGLAKAGKAAGAAAATAGRDAARAPREPAEPGRA